MGNKNGNNGELEPGSYSDPPDFDIYDIKEAPDKIDMYN